MYFVQRQYRCLILLGSCRITYTLHTVFCTKTFMSYSSGFLSNYLRSIYCCLYKDCVYHILPGFCRIMYTVHTVFCTKTVYIYIYIYIHIYIYTYIYVYHVLSLCRITYTVRSVFWKKQCIYYILLGSCRIMYTVHTVFCTKAVYVIFFCFPVEFRTMYIPCFDQRQYTSYSSGLMYNYVNCA